MEIEVNGVVYESEVEGNGVCRGCIAEYNAVLCEAITGKTDCVVDYYKGLVWKIKEVKEPIKPKEKENIMQKKEIDKSKKYKTVRGVPVELVYDNYRNGMEYLWVSFPEDEGKFVFSTNKYGENSMSGVYNLVEFNPLEELSKMPVDTLVKVTEKSNGATALRYLSSVDLKNKGARLFSYGGTSRTATDAFFYPEEDYTFEIIE